MRISPFRVGVGLTLALASIQLAGASSTPLAPAPPPIVPATTTLAAFADYYVHGPVGSPKLVHDVSEFEHSFGTVAENHSAGLEIQLYFRNGGREAWVERLDRGMLLASQVHALTQELDAIPDFNLLVIPPLAALSSDEAAKTDASILRYTESRQAFLVLDSPTALQLPGPDPVDPVIKWVRDHEELRQSSGALYFPRVEVAEKTVVEASGAVAGRIVATDLKHGVWTAPAGTANGELTDVYSLEFPLSPHAPGRLTAEGINPIEIFTGYGALIFGARTLRGNDALADDFKFIQVKRLNQFMERSISHSSGWLADHAINNALLHSVSAWINPFLAGLEREQAFFNYNVTCDPTNNSPEDAVQGRVNVLIHYAPIRPAEFIPLNLVLKARPENSSHRP